MREICSWYGISRQAHYQHQAHQQARAAEAAVVSSLVRSKRRRHCRMGARKLHRELRPALARKGIKVGRDRFFDILREANLLVRAQKRKSRTTWPGSWRCENLLAGLELKRANQIWVSDITYLESEAGYCYLSLVTDLYSRCILGYHVSDSLGAEGSLAALKMATRRAPVKGCIHHSDRGIQYTCNLYRSYLRKKGMRSSMGASGNCYDNAVAERVNGILKLEYGLEANFIDLKEASAAVKEAIWLYNHERPHLSLDYQKPEKVYIHSINNL